MTGERSARPCELDDAVRGADEPTQEDGADDRDDDLGQQSDRQDVVVQEARDGDPRDEPLEELLPGEGDRLDGGQAHSDRSEVGLALASVKGSPDEGRDASEEQNEGDLDQRREVPVTRPLQDEIPVVRVGDRDQVRERVPDEQPTEREGEEDGTAETGTRCGGIGHVNAVAPSGRSLIVR